MRSLITIHSTGFVIKGNDGVCRARKFEPDGTTRIVDTSYCDARGAKLEAETSGLGGVSRPLGDQNGVYTVCVRSSFGTGSDIPQSLRGTPRVMYVEVPIYGTNMWLCTYSGTSGVYSAQEMNLTKAQVLAQQECIPPSSATPAPSTEPTFTEYTGRYDTPITENLNWRIIAAAAILIITGLYALKLSRK